MRQTDRYGLLKSSSIRPTIINFGIMKEKTKDHHLSIQISLGTVENVQPIFGNQANE